MPRRSPSPANRSHVNYNETRSDFGSPRTGTFSLSRSGYSSGTPSHVQSPYQYPDYDPSRNIFGRSTPVSMNSTAESWGGNQSWPRGRMAQNVTSEGLPYATPARSVPRRYNQSGLTSFTTGTPGSYQYSGYSGGSPGRSPYQYPDYDPAKGMFGRMTPVSMHASSGDSWGGQQTWPGARFARRSTPLNNDRSRYVRGMGSMPAPHNSPSRLASPGPRTMSGFGSSGYSGMSDASSFMQQARPTSTPAQHTTIEETSFYDDGEAKQTVNKTTVRNPDQTFETSVRQDEAGGRVLDPNRDRAQIEHIIEQANYKDRCEDQRRIFNTKQKREVEVFEELMQNEIRNNPGDRARIAADFEAQRQNLLKRMEEEREEFETYLHNIRPGGPGTSFSFDEDDDWESHTERTPYVSAVQFSSSGIESGGSPQSFGATFDNNATSSGPRRVVQRRTVSGDNERMETTTVIENEDGGDSHAAVMIQGINDAIDELIIRQIETMREVLKMQKAEVAESGGQASPALVEQHREIVEEMNRMNTEEINYMVEDLMEAYEMEIEQNNGELIRINESTTSGPGGVTSERTETIEESPGGRRQERMPLPPESATIGELVLAILHNHFLDTMRLRTQLEEDEANMQLNIELMDHQLKVKEEIRLIIEIFKTKYRDNIVDTSNSFTETVERSVSEGSVHRRQNITTSIRPASEVEIERLTNLLSRKVLKHRGERQAFLQQQQQETEERGESNDLNAKHQAEIAAFDESQLRELQGIEQQIHALREAANTTGSPGRFRSSPVIGASAHSTPRSANSSLMYYDDEVRGGSESPRMNISSPFPRRQLDRSGMNRTPRGLTAASPPRFVQEGRRPENMPSARMMEWARLNNVAVRPDSFDGTGPPIPGLMNESLGRSMASGLMNESAPGLMDVSMPGSMGRRSMSPRSGLMDESMPGSMGMRSMGRSGLMDGSMGRRSISPGRSRLMDESMPSAMGMRSMSPGLGLMDESMPSAMGMRTISPGRSLMNETPPGLMGSSRLMDESMPSLMNRSSPRGRGRHQASLSPRRRANRPSARMMEWARQNNVAVRPDSFSDSSPVRPPTSTPIRARPAQINGIAIRPDSFSGDMPPARAFLPSPARPPRRPAQINGITIRPDSFSGDMPPARAFLPSPARPPRRPAQVNGITIRPDSFSGDMPPARAFNRSPPTRRPNIHEQSTQLIESPGRRVFESTRIDSSLGDSDIHEQSTHIIERPSVRRDIHEQSTIIDSRRSPGGKSKCAKSCPCCTCNEVNSCVGNGRNNAAPVQTLDEIELTERDELQRHLRRWQSARRDVLTSISPR